MHCKFKRNMYFPCVCVRVFSYVNNYTNEIFTETKIKSINTTKSDTKKKDTHHEKYLHLEVKNLQNSTFIFPSNIMAFEQTIYFIFMFFFAFGAVSYVYGSMVFFFSYFVDVILYINKYLMFCYQSQQRFCMVK